MFDGVLKPPLIYYALSSSQKKVSKKQLHGLTFIFQMHEKYLRTSSLIIKFGGRKPVTTQNI